ncbi:MAG TPA: UDP-glucose/GDP-mannose dehydrogenase family protein [Vicinamibacterales bacterium]|nr:UDP-glucose/GDP-mannose dehydrogenase family protein [Vicinamibacterales bacterium]HPW20768.1 UDP-glucose/GDP-mannose dehydrogenase family protein [Vicinamibacterales bacterium]
MKIAVIGTGHVGLVAGACLAGTGNTVVCVDQDAATVRRLRRGALPFFEPGLEELVRRNASEKRLSFTTQLSRAVRASPAIIIAAGAPPGEDGGADLPRVLAVAREIARSMNGYKVIVVASTVPVGTAAKVRETVRRETTHPFSVVSAPAFLTRGAAVGDFLRPDRVVVGAEDERGAEIVRQLYAPFTRTGGPALVMDCASAELSKHAANAFLAARISLMNEIANACEALGADVEQVRRAIGADRRIGPSFLFPGIGYGGAFSRDIRALVRSAGDKGYQFHIPRAVERVNEAQKSVLAAKMARHFGSLEGRTIAVWGLAFRPGTDDVRDAPSLALIDQLLSAGARIQAYDPAAMPGAKRVFGARITLAPGAHAALAGADALALVTEWHEFLEPDFGKMRKLMKSPVVFDGRNAYSRDTMRAHGFTYYGIGR